MVVPIDLIANYGSDRGKASDYVGTTSYYEDRLLIMVVDIVTQSSSKYARKLATWHLIIVTMLILNSTPNSGPLKPMLPILPTLIGCSILESHHTSQMIPSIYKFWLLTKGWSTSLLRIENKLLWRMKDEASCKLLIASSISCESIMHQYYHIISFLFNN